MKEEAGNIEVSPMEYETSKRIDDWRYRSEKDKITTTLFSCDYVFGSPTPQDDIEALEWFDTEELQNMIDKSLINPSHTKLIELLYSKYKKQ